MPQFRKAWLSGLLVIACLCLHGQSRPMELYDLFRSLLSDSTAPIYPIPWSKASTISVINWQNTLPVWKDSVWSMRGTLPVSLNGKTFACGVNTTEACPFTVTLEGTEKGYTRFTIDHLISNEIQPRAELSFLFNRPVKEKLIRKITDSGLVQLTSYSLRFPDRPKCWMLYGMLKNVAGNGIFLKVFLDKESMMLAEPKSKDVNKTFPQKNAMLPPKKPGRES
ncbi:MAG TPA: hypothetical protein PKK69_08450 [Ferruginibacter sp.]|nr:hypothetical protein [Ferruginibacter sp.]